jgi:hypothetical protein
MNLIGNAPAEPVYVILLPASYVYTLDPSKGEQKITANSVHLAGDAIRAIIQAAAAPNTATHRVFSVEKAVLAIHNVTI